MKRLFLLIKFGLLFSFVSGFLIMSWYLYVANRYKSLIFKPENCPKFQIAMILGTSKYLKSGNENLFYRYRLNAASVLHDKHIVKYWLVSGDNSAIRYNEPEAMRADLIKLGVAPGFIQPDYAGLRTLDSIYRMEEVFGNTRYVIVSQPFHLARALYIAKSRGHDVYGCYAKMPNRRFAIKTQIREVFARVKLFFDLYILNTQAKFYGEQIAFPP